MQPSETTISDYFGLLQYSWQTMIVDDPSPNGMKGLFVHPYLFFLKKHLKKCILKDLKLNLDFQI